jgi:hypothetical protein
MFGIREIIFFTTLILIYTFDASKFDTCEGIGFCKRLRREQVSAYKIKEFSSSEKEISGLLTDDETKYNDPIRFTISLFENGIFRIKIKEEVNSDQVLTKRHEVKDVILENVKEKEIKMENNRIKSGNVELRVNNSPFYLSLFYEDREVLQFNSKNLLKVENVLREKVPKNETENIEGYGNYFLKKRWRKCYRI